MMSGFFTRLIDKFYELKRGFDEGTIDLGTGVAIQLANLPLVIMEPLRELPDSLALLLYEEVKRSPAVSAYRGSAHGMGSVICSVILAYLHFIKLLAPYCTEAEESQMDDEGFKPVYFNLQGTPYARVGRDQTRAQLKYLTDELLPGSMAMAADRFGEIQKRLHPWGFKLIVLGELEPTDPDDLVGMFTIETTLLVPRGSKLTGALTEMEFQPDDGDSQHAPEEVKQ